MRCGSHSHSSHHHRGNTPGTVEVVNDSFKAEAKRLTHYSGVITCFYCFPVMSKLYESGTGSNRKS